MDVDEIGIRRGSGKHNLINLGTRRDGDVGRIR